MLERDDHGVGMELWLRMKAVDDLACYTIKSDGIDGCHVAFLMKEYRAGDKGLRLIGAIVRIVNVFLPDNPNRTVRCRYHHNYSCAVGKIVSLSVPKNNNQNLINRSI